MQGFKRERSGLNQGFSRPCSAYVSLCSSDHGNTTESAGVSGCDILKQPPQAQLKS